MSIWDDPEHLLMIRKVNEAAPANQFTFYILGPTGCGKTAIAASMLQHATNSERNTLFVGETDYLADQRHKLFVEDEPTDPTNHGEYEFGSILCSLRTKKPGIRDLKLSFLVVAKRGEDLLREGPCKEREDRIFR